MSTTFDIFVVGGGGGGATHQGGNSAGGGGGGIRVTVTRITEQLQSDLILMLKLKRAGIQPGREVLLGAVEGGVRVCGEDGTNSVASEDLPDEVASHVFVSRE